MAVAVVVMVVISSSKITTILVVVVSNRCYDFGGGNSILVGSRHRRLVVVLVVAAAAAGVVVAVVVVGQVLFCPSGRAGSHNTENSALRELGRCTRLTSVECDCPRIIVNSGRDDSRSCVLEQNPKIAPWSVSQPQ